MALRPHGTGGRLWGVTLGVKSKYPSQNKRKNQRKTKNIAENKAMKHRTKLKDNIKCS
jgi:hypothetical protein